MNERRGVPRHRVLKTGTIEFAGESLVCTVRSLSASGARIEVNTPLWFPDRFTRAIPSEGWRKPCHIIWRDEKLVGVAFEAS